MVFDKPYQTLKMGLDHFSARLFTIYNYACELSLAFPRAALWQRAEKTAASWVGSNL
jgi:hypothetical protein